MPQESFQGLRVLAFESRRAGELATLIATFGGHPLTAPAVREVPLESNAEALAFGAALLAGGFDAVVFLTGAGARALVAALEPRYPGEAIVAALSRTKVIARGPKPVAVLREWQVPVWLIAPEPNTWQALTDAIDARAAEWSLGGARVAVQEDGVPCDDLVEALGARGADVTRVPVYRWALPEDVEPLKRAVIAIAEGEVEVAMFTTGVQVVHLQQVAREMGMLPAVEEGLRRMVVASIGPTTSGELRRHGVRVDIEASHPKIGYLTREAAGRAGDLLRTRRAR